MNGQALVEAFDDGTRCRHCGMVERLGYFKRAGRVYATLQWWAPDGRLLGVRPIEVVPGAAPDGAPELTEAHPGAEVIRSPQCPKTPAAWGTPDEPARIRVEA